MKPITQEEKNGREFVFNLMPALTKMSPADQEKEKEYYLNVPIQEVKSRPQIDQEAVRSETALLAIQRKELEKIVELQKTVADGFEKLKSINFGAELV